MLHSISRREALLTGALAAAALATNVAGQPAPTPTPVSSVPKRTLRKAVMLGMVGEGATVLEKFQILKDCGFDGCEIDSPTPTPMSEFVKAQEETGIKAHGVVDSVHWKFHFNAPDAQVRQKALEGLETAIRDAKAVGASSVLLVPGVVSAKQSYDDAWKYTLEGIAKALPLAQECNVKIAIENVWNNFLLSPIEAARYVDEFKHPMLAFHFDIGNVINTGFPDQWIRILGKRIVKLHIKDYSRKKRDDLGLWKGFDVELGEGDGNYASVMKALDEIGYSTAPEGNWATAEVSGGDRARLIKVREQMDKLLAM
jgi:hexulose-6-phosphate isomerase